MTNIFESIAMYILLTGFVALFWGAWFYCILNDVPGINALILLGVLFPITLPILLLLYIMLFFKAVFNGFGELFSFIKENFKRDKGS